MVELQRHAVANRWQDWVNLALAAWLFISPWVLQLGAGEGSQAASVVFWIMGIVIAAISIAALVRARPWEEWVNILAGALVFISPWVLGFAGLAAALWNAVIVGALVFLLAVWDLNTMPEAARHGA